MSRTPKLSANVEEDSKDFTEEEENEENLDIIQNLSAAFEKPENDGGFSRRETLLNKELHDLSLLDASTNMSFLG